MLAVKTVDLRKHYTLYRSFSDRLRNRGMRLEVLKGTNLEIKKGEIFGLLGPNGAGKTTLINVLATLLLPDSGKAEVFGLDVTEDAEEIRKIITLCSAYTGFYDEQTVKEILDIFARIYGTDRRRIDKIVSTAQLGNFKNTMFSELSSGNKQKVSIAKFLSTNAKVLLLDELTVGLDPDIASHVRELIKLWNKKKKTTVFLTTHNMYEADQLCERVAIIHKGEIVACDAPSKLKKIIKEEECIEIIVTEFKDPSKFLSRLEGIKRVSFKNYLIIVHVDDAEKRLQKIIEVLISRNYHIKTIKVREPTLEDVFLKLVGVGLK